MRGQRFTLAPTVDVFVTRHLTLGAAAEIDYDRTSFAHSYSLGGNGRLGVYGVVARHWAIWPTLALGAATYKTTLPDDNSRVSLRARLDVPVLFYPAPGFFVGAGPLVGFVGELPRGRFEPYVTLGVLTKLGGTF